MARQAQNASFKLLEDTKLEGVYLVSRFDSSNKEDGEDAQQPLSL